MKIKLGDVIRDDKGREGTVVNIGIATDPTDIAGELGLNAKEYDTDFKLYWCNIIWFKLVLF